MVNQSRRRRVSNRSQELVPSVDSVRDHADSSSSESAHRWYTMDLHVHTPASTDYQQPQVRFLDILRQADQREIDILAFTDHNSVRGYADLWREIEDLELLEYLDRLQPDESERLAEYRSLLDRILLLPGFEFTATFGFHILAIFPEQTTIRMMEHLLLLLGISESRFGSGEVGATTDVLRTYDILNSHGALVIGAHVNSANGIAMQGLRFGGQTKIAYTQDPNLHALEVTDLVVHGGRRSTAAFFDGSKPEYSRRMHIIQGSDAHRLERDVDRPSNLGVGDRATDVRLPEISFAALKTLFTSTDFDRSRPHINRDDPFEMVRAARIDGNTDQQSFHETLTQKRTGAGNVLRDIVAFANTGGGRVFVGASANERRPVAGLPDPRSTTAELQREVERNITPPLTIEVQTLPVGSKHVLAVTVPPGPDKPYAQQNGGIFVRRGGESEPATRDEIVAMVRGTALPAPTKPVTPEVLAAPVTSAPAPAVPESTQATPEPEPDSAPAPSDRNKRRRSGRQQATRAAKPAETHDDVTTPPAIPPITSTGERPLTSGQPELDPIAPRIGVEVVDKQEVEGETVFTMRDLRSGALTHNVPMNTKGRLWRYAIQEQEHRPVDPGKVSWHGNYGYVKAYRPRNEKVRHNLAYRDNSTMRVFYGVTEDGMSDTWKATLPARSS